MPPTLFNVAIGVLLGCALLGSAFDRRSVAVVAVVAALPDTDAAVSLFVVGATNAAFHTLFVPAIAVVGLYADTELREESWLRSRYGTDGVRIVWVAVASYLVAGIGADLFSGEGVALLYPLSDIVYVVVGTFVVSTQEGIVQTYLTIGGERLIELRSPGTTTTHHVASWINPTPGISNPAGVERRLRLVGSGPQAVVIATAVAALLTRSSLERIGTNETGSAETPGEGDLD